MTGGEFVERRQGERRAGERDRNRMLEHLVAAERDERRRLALVLHDGAVQSLAGIALMLDSVEHSIAQGRTDHALEVLRAALKRQRETIQSLRDLSFDVEPIVLRDRGFASAVQALAELVGLDRQVRIEVDVAAGEELSEDAQVALYQIVRETLEHAVGRRPTVVRITVTGAGPGDAVLTIADDGKPERRRRVADGIEERARPLSGRVEVDATDDGTTVTVTLPAYAARD